MPIIECELVGEDGTIYPYRFAGPVSIGQSQYLMFDEANHLAQSKRQRVYAKLRLRSSQPILCAEARLDCHRPPGE